MARYKTQSFAFNKYLYWISFGFIFLLSIPSFGQVKTEIIFPDSNVVFKTAEMEGVIFGMNFKWRFMIDSTRTIEHDPLKVMAGEENAVRYMPDIGIAEQIEMALKSFIQDSDNFIANNLQLYTKQYFGYITSTGDSIIWINCFHDEEIKMDEYWKSSFVSMYDGGHNYFKVRYNLSRREFFDLWINGL